MQACRPVDLIDKYYRNSPAAQNLLQQHSRQVCKLALKIARSNRALTNSIDLQFLAQAAMLHDIGMIFTHAPELHCYGQSPYLAHGIIGHDLLTKEGLPQHARVCERHTGVGLTAQEIAAQNLPLPQRDMLPETLEEQIICFADLFFSKNLRERNLQKSRDQVAEGLRRYGAEKVIIFDNWCHRFDPDGRLCR